MKRSLSAPRAYALLVDLAAVALCLVAVRQSPMPTGEDVVGFGVLAVALATHIIVVWRGEERRRDRAMGPIFDLTSVWTFAAVVVLPATLALVLIVGMRIGTYRIRRRPWWRYLFGTAVILGSAAAAEILLAVVDAPLSGGSIGGQALLLVTLTAAAGVYWLIQAAAHAGILTLSLPGERFRDQWGTRTENLIEAGTLAVAALLGAVMTHGTLFPLLLLAVLAPLNLLLADRQADAAELREHARTDARTGLLNARGLAEQGTRVLQRCQAAASPAAMLIIDLDHFKSINDSWGHPAGDAVLGAVGRVLQHAVRPGDVAARDGGEEFVIVLPDTTISDAAAVADRIRTELAALEVVATDKNGSPILITDRTASIGVAAQPDHGTTFEDLRQAADAALYEAKNAGRDRTVLVTESG
ncbi:GGDEF domain-containing protein [Haloechinothrix halophila]|uniref:GGDEF domain-containing protein n=1 Tax=Haloechinothrix halophila TaxID=1069073 RepID=UPI0005534217|nr:GGDEF domain-containing protein [Haloechinothrix halophila]